MERLADEAMIRRYRGLNGNLGFRVPRFFNSLRRAVFPFLNCRQQRAPAKQAARREA